MNREAAAQSIIDRLSPLRDVGVVVRSLPDKPRDVAEQYKNGIITLKWANDEFGSPQSMDLLIQERVTTWQLDIRLTNLKNQDGAYPVIEAIEALLLGFRPVDGREAYCTGTQFEGQQQAMWVFSMNWTVPGLMVERSPADVGALLKRITFIDEFQGVVVFDEQV